MSDPTQEELLGYVLGALEDDEEQSIREQLKADPRLRQELAEVRRRLRALEDTYCELAPPAGLAGRTCAYVASVSGTHTPVPAAGRTMTPLPLLGGVSGGFHTADLLAVCGVGALVVALLLPALAARRFDAQITACQDNLRLVTQALEVYSDNHSGYFPMIPAQGKSSAAGIYAPTLLRSGYLTEDRSLLCPGSSRVQKGRFHVPTVEELEQADAPQLPQLLAEMGGSYGYSLGHVTAGRYQGTRNAHRVRFALVADMPSDRPDHQSFNHGGRGQNVAFEDGHVVFLTSSRPGPQLDDIYVNDAGQVDAGLHADDAVIAPSYVRPVALRSSK